MPNQAEQNTQILFHKTGQLTTQITIATVISAQANLLNKKSALHNGSYHTAEVCISISLLMK